MKWLIDNQGLDNRNTVGVISNPKSCLFFHKYRALEGAPEYAYVYDSFYDFLTNGTQPEFVFRWSRRAEGLLLRYLNEHFSDGYEHGGLKGLCFL